MFRFVDPRLTWYGDDWNVLIGHHPRRVTLLHVEVGRLEESPAVRQREGGGAQWGCSSVKARSIDTDNARVK